MIHSVQRFANAILVFGCVTAFQASLALAKSPNVLFIICDDLNTNVSTSGFTNIKTPAFERVASTGMTFRRAYCQYPVCGPSRASLLHGLYPESTGVLDNKSDIQMTRPGTKSLPQLLKESGYWTGSVGKVFHNAKIDPGDLAWDQVLRFENDEMPMVTPIRKAFEEEHGTVTSGKSRRQWREFYPTIATQTRGQQPGYGPSGLDDNQHKDGRNAQKICEWLLGNVEKDKPFFMACGIQKPHVPFLAPDKYFAMYPKNELTIRPASLDYWQTVPKLAQTKRYTGFGFEFGVENDDLRRDYVQAYHACISFIDAQIGRILDALKQSGHWEDTIVILTSDHGYLLGEKFMWGKVMLFEQCSRVPLIIRVPVAVAGGSTTPGSTSDELVELVDLYPTIAELCNLAQPPHIQGSSLKRLLKNPNAKGKQVAYTVVSRGEHLGRAIRTQRFRYVAWPTGEELYNLENDPREESNLCIQDDFEGMLDEMRSLLIDATKNAIQHR
ncbi:MAG: sulfatase [Planctomycetota bacterium]